MIMKRGQMELMGLAMVIVLISIGVLFVVKFNVLKEPADTKKDYSYSEIASNTLSAMLLSTSGDGCKNINIRDLLIDCTDNPYDENNVNDIEGGSIECNDGTESCFYAEYVINEILEKTLDEWGFNYNLDVSTALDNTLNMSRGDCSGERKSSLFFFETAGQGTMFIRLDVCG